MVRPPRIEYPGALYHVTGRGNEKKEIYLDDLDRRSFLKILSKVISDYEWKCYAYCLMGNHYHLLFETQKANLSEGMRQLNGIYAQRFNKRHQRCGHLFQGRFHAELVDKEEYLLEVVRYIVLNPVRAGFCEDPSFYKWSSHLDMLGSTKSVDFLCSDIVLSFFSEYGNDTLQQYKVFVLRGIGRDSLPGLKEGILLGKEGFKDKVAKHISLKGGCKSISYRQRFVLRPELQEIFRDLGYDRKERNKRIILAHSEHGYRLKEIADFIGLHPSTVGKIVTLAG